MADTQIWRPDTCDCVVEVRKSDWAWVSTVQRCKLHKAEGAAHLAEVLAHHKPYNDLSQYPDGGKSRDAKDREKLGLDDKGNVILGDTPAERHQKWLSATAKADERERIRKLKDGGAAPHGGNGDGLR